MPQKTMRKKTAAGLIKTNPCGSLCFYLQFHSNKNIFLINKGKFMIISRNALYFPADGLFHLFLHELTLLFTIVYVTPSIVTVPL